MASHFAIHDPEVRLKLEVRARPYFVRLADGLHLGYRKGKSISRWVTRIRRGGQYRTRTLVGVEPDDRLPADGRVILNFHQMVGELMKDDQNTVCCSFCGKSSQEVAKLIAGPGVFICDACVALCQLYLDHPTEEGKLLLEDGEPVLEDGEPVFVPLSPEEEALKERVTKGST